MSDNSTAVEKTNSGGGAVAKVGDLRGMLEKAKSKFAAVASKHLTPERLIQLTLTATSRNPKLLQCSPESVLQFCMRCSETGLAPIGAGGAWPVPYENRKTGKVEMQFIPDYRGLISAAKRAGCITDAWAEVVRRNDEFDYELGLANTLRHKPTRVDRGELENAYCVFIMPDGSKRFVVMDKDEVNGIRARSRASNSGPWVTDEAEMWKKTITRRAMKPFAGASPELDAAIEADNQATGLRDVTDSIEIKAPQAKKQAVAPAAAPVVECDPEPVAVETEQQAPEPEPNPRDDLLKQAKSMASCAVKGPLSRALKACNMKDVADLETADANVLADFIATLEAN